MVARGATSVAVMTGALIVAGATPGTGQTTGPGEVVRAEWSSDPRTATGVTAAVLDVTGQTRDVVLTVESVDGSFGVAKGGRRTTVTVSADVLFGFDTSDLTAAARAKLADTAAELRDAEATGTVVVGGHADSVGNPTYNQVLSERRARAVAAALDPLVRDLEVTLQPQGYGDTKPVAEEKKSDGSDDPAGRARNRRVTVTFTR
jgi:outer membrane protein OmpA-like peptidoglycan-associated protein